MTRLQDQDTFTIDDVRAAIARNAPDELPLVPLTVAMTWPDLAQAMDVCIELAKRDNTEVRGNALISLGHLARRFRQLDQDRIRPLIESGLADPDASLRDKAKSAADEIHQFLHWTFRNHRYG